MREMTTKEKAHRVIILLALIVLACDLLWWRSG